MAKLALLRDSFSGASIDSTLWPTTYGTAGIDTGRCKLPSVGTTYSGITSATDWDATESGIAIQFTPPALGDTREFSLSVVVDGSNQLQMFVSGTTTLFLRRKLAGANSDATLTYSSTDHLWWRIRESGGTAFWDTSPDGVTWTNRRTLSHSLTLTAVSADISCGAYGTETNSDAFVDNVNIYPLAPPPRGTYRYRLPLLVR